MLGAPIACLPLLDFRLPPRQLDVAPLREVRGVRIACGQLEARAGHGKISQWTLAAAGCEKWMEQRGTDAVRVLKLERLGLRPIC